MTALDPALVWGAGVPASAAAAVSAAAAALQDLDPWVVFLVPVPWAVFPGLDLVPWVVSPALVPWAVFPGLDPVP